ncbi:ABC transporter substrate-binding protein [Williamsia sp. CHRR-6]|uniref:ABC transporter substrate-binding protein n=1 Tax=Williamsia sp. CHRR-6 TaxID=2835871 RepID=UPI001BDB161E|nr:ABC transporter substrate-binding protein [Williamsia sp. CHRR-6]MBT0566806.1 ABC transporter substrate-binding protein [Williamsia sp. CHRR-6]
MALVRRLALAVTIPALLLSAACSTDDGDSSTGPGSTSQAALPTVGVDAAAAALLPAEAKARGSLSLALDLKYPPTSYLDTDNKTPIGYNVDIGKLIGQALGLRVDVKNVPFDNVIPGIASGRYDFTATNLTPTAERLKVLDMVTYWADGSSLVTTKGNPEGLSLVGNKVCGKKIAVTVGSTQQETYLPQLSKQCTESGKPAVQTVVLPDVQGALTQIASKRVDGLFGDTPQVGFAAKEKPDLFELTTPQYEKTEGDDVVALGVKKGSSLGPAIQKALTAIMATPAYKAALARWGLETGAIENAELLTK